MRYMIKGELELKIDDTGLFPCSCGLRIGGGLTDQDTAHLCGLCEHPRCMEGAAPPLSLSEFRKSTCDL